MRDYIWVFKNEFETTIYFASDVVAYNYAEQYLKDVIIGEETTTDLNEDYESALDELRSDYNKNKNHFGVDGMFIVNREKVQS